jgi:hypothetical protein
MTRDRVPIIGTPPLVRLQSGPWLRLPSVSSESNRLWEAGIYSAPRPDTAQEGLNFPSPEAKSQSG